ncbi:MAG: signal peptidase II [Pseudobdellovibrio sp.]
MKSKLMYLISISSLVIALDQITKLLVHTRFQLHESVAVIPNYFNITYVRNFGAAFGILAQTPPAFREIFFLAMPPFACLLVLYIIWGLKESQSSQTIALSFVFGGAIGNYLDRVKYKYVVDFIDFHYYNKQTWPAFNIADVAIVGGVFALIYLIFLERKSEENQHTT